MDNSVAERQLFLYELTGRGYEFRNKSWHDDWERFEDDQLNMAWEMWLASKNREGYKLVPLELVDEIEDKIWGNLSANHTITNQEGDGFIPVEDIDLGTIYKAMIGAVDE